MNRKLEKVGDMAMSKKISTALLMMVLLILIPPFVFMVSALFSGMSVGETWAALVDQAFSRKQNLLMVGVFSWLPLALLAVVLWCHRRFGGSEDLRPVLLWTGFLPIFLVMVWVNFEYWPDFLPGRVYPGFPHGLEFVIGPLFFAPAGMAVCMFVAWLAARKSA
jgi:hypothetical protein